MSDLSYQEALVFADHGEWMAALVRLGLQALRADDAKAVEAALFCLRDYLVKVLRRHLSKDPHWDSKGRGLDALNEGPPDTALPGRFKLGGQLMWATADQQHRYRDPFELDLELCPVTGAFRRYTMRFADNRPLAEKAISYHTDTAVAGREKDGWAFVFHGERLD
jgi:hypothetical protein